MPLTGNTDVNEKDKIGSWNLILTPYNDKNNLLHIYIQWETQNQPYFNVYMQWDYSIYKVNCSLPIFKLWLYYKEKSLREREREREREGGTEWEKEKERTFIAMLQLVFYIVICRGKSSALS